MSRIQKLESTIAWMLSRRSSDMPVSLHPPGYPYSMQYGPNTSPASHIRASPPHSQSSTPKVSQQCLIDITNDTSSANSSSAANSSSSASVSPSTSTSKPSSKLLQTLTQKKESNPLPSIDRSKLLYPENVVEKYPQFLVRSKLPTLAVKLCKESYFGKEIMLKCTVKGTGQYHALPEATMKDLKIFMTDLCVPRHTATKLEFEVTWKACIESIGQACKTLRKKHESELI